MIANVASAWWSLSQLLKAGRQQAGDAEVPEHQLYQRRHVAVVGDVDADGAFRDAAWHQPDHEQQDAQAHRQDPGARAR